MNTWIKDGEKKYVQNGKYLSGNSAFYRVCGYITFEYADYPNQLVRHILDEIKEENVKKAEEKGVCWSLRHDESERIFCGGNFADSNEGVDEFSYYTPSDSTYSRMSVQADILTIKELIANNRERKKYGYTCLPFKNVDINKSVYIRYLVHDFSLSEKTSKFLQEYGVSEMTDTENAIKSANKDIQELIELLNASGNACKFEKLSASDYLQMLCVNDG